VDNNIHTFPGYPYDAIVALAPYGFMDYSWHIRHKFQWRYKLVALLTDVNHNMQIWEKKFIPMFELLSKWGLSWIGNLLQNVH
jgi:hypothetical protein